MNADSSSLANTEWSSDPVLPSLRSATGAAARRERALLEGEWRQLREDARAGRVGLPQTQAAFAVVLRAHAAICRAEELAREKRVAEVEPLITRDLVRDLEAAATVLASSTSLSAEARESIGWQWGACGFRRCGAQADAAQALSKLRANMGMVVPLEALFYLDVAKRAVDEILQLGVGDGVLAQSQLPARIGPADYLPRETLEMILPAEDVASGDANLPIYRGGNTEAETALEEYEASLLEELERSNSGGGD